MNTHAFFILLLATGLSAKKTSEFEIDFQKMVNTVKVEDNKTLLNCTENCTTMKGTGCECVHFDHCLKNDVIECIKKGLEKLKFRSDGINQICKRLQTLKQSPPRPTVLPRHDTDPWNKTVSPKHFLDYIRSLAQEMTTLKS